MFNKLITIALVSTVLASGLADTSFAQGCGGGGEAIQFSAGHQPKSMIFRPVTKEEREAAGLEQLNRFLRPSPVTLPENAVRYHEMTRAGRVRHWVDIMARALDR